MRTTRRRMTLVAVLAALAVPLVTGCGSDDDGAPAPTTTRAAQEATGFGFRVQVPPGWTDVSDQLNTAAVRYDVAAGDTRATGFKANVTIRRDSGRQLEGATVDAIDRDARRLADREPGTTVRAGGRLALDGEPARERTVVRRQDGQRLAGRTVIALRGGELYSLLLTTAADDPRAEGILRTMLASWRWTR